VSQGVVFDEAKHRLETARVAGVDDSQPIVAAVHEGVRAANARDRRNHVPIID
jgi:hypothetical protein